MNIMCRYIHINMRLSGIKVFEELKAFVCVKKNMKALVGLFDQVFLLTVKGIYYIYL